MVKVCGDHGQVRRHEVLFRGQQCSHRAWIEALRNYADARRVLSDALRDAPFAAYFWETPALRHDHEDGPAEFVVVENTSLARARPDASAFAAVFDGTHSAVATFPNLAGDAVLVAPHPTHAPDSAHLAACVRSAPAAVVDTLWVAVATAVSEWLAARREPVWVSTSGLAVPWLHVRLDRAPKYYSHREYAKPTSFPVLEQ
jgi:hypothetical protein